MRKPPTRGRDAGHAVFQHAPQSRKCVEACRSAGVRPAPCQSETYSVLESVQPRLWTWRGEWLGVGLPVLFQKHLGQLARRGLCLAQFFSWQGSPARRPGTMVQYLRTYVNIISNLMYS